MAEQKRGRRIAMSGPELDEFLASERTCRVGTIGADGAPHVTPLWFVWDGTSLWLYSITRSKRTADLRRNPAASVLVDAGHEYVELRGAELVGEFQPVGESPRTGEAVPELVAVERAFARKYFGIDELPHDGRHAWHRMTPDSIRSWDFRKIGN